MKVRPARAGPVLPTKCPPIRLGLGWVKRIPAGFMIVMKSTPVSRRTRSAYGCNTDVGLGSASASRTLGLSATVSATVVTVRRAFSLVTRRASRDARYAPATTRMPTMAACNASNCRARLQRLPDTDYHPPTSHPGQGRRCGRHRRERNVHKRDVVRGSAHSRPGTARTLPNARPRSPTAIGSRFGLELPRARAGARAGATHQGRGLPEGPHRAGLRPRAVMIPYEPLWARWNRITTIRSRMAITAR